MSHHNLKLFTDHFQPVVDGLKKSEVRLNDRDFRIGDTLTLHEGHMEEGSFVYSGRSVSAQVTYIDNFGLCDGYVNLSLGRVGLMIIEDLRDSEVA